jgi:hypothetical protein
VGGAGAVACLLSIFLLFRTKYVRYLMAFWCMFFYEGFDIRFWDIEISQYF